VFTRISLALLLAAPLPGAAQQISIRMEPGGFRIDGWQPSAPPTDGWPSVFQVYAGEGSVPAMLGFYSVDAGTLVFRPRFPVSPGMHLRAVFHPPGAAPIEAAFDVAKPALASTTRVAHVYPSASILPENQLKFYIYFSAPMGKGRAWQKVHLLDAAGKPVTLPFLELDEELWDRDGTRLTVLFDPGRIKREVLPLREIGPSIEAGKRYTLLVDRDFPDGRGAPLAEEYRKEFRVAAADRTPPETSNWRVASPRAGTTEPLVLTFPEPLDYALLQHLIEVIGPDGAVVGRIVVEREETEWRFAPQQPWKAGDYHLSIQTTLEDLAGNHIGRPFDVDTFDPITRTIPRDTVSLQFRVRK
jgi:hypothetical protein